MLEGSRSGSGSIPLTNGSGSGSRRPKNTWIWGDLDPDPDPDPQHYSYVHIHKQRIFKIQKKAIRIVTGSLYNAHTAPLFTQHNILPYEKLITFSQLMFMHSIEYNYSPSSFENIWLKNNHRD